MRNDKSSIFHRLARFLGWNRASYFLLSAFLMTIFLIAYVWWPLAVDAMAYVNWQGPWWLYFDWLLVGIFLVMTLLVMAGADLKADAWIVFVGLVGGLVIESWGTQTGIWWYFTDERPPLWIIPAWPIASLSIDRLVRILHRGTLSLERIGGRLGFIENRSPKRGLDQFYTGFYWLLFLSFFFLMLMFTWSTIDKPMTVLALILVGFLTLTTADPKLAVLTFLAGASLGFFLEYWGTTRECWNYYTLAKPPLFAVFAHGMASVAFWRTILVLKVFTSKVRRSGQQ